MEIESVTEVQRLQFKPGDALVVRTEHVSSPAESDFIQAHVRAVLGLREDFPVLVLPAGFSLEVAERP